MTVARVRETGRGWYQGRLSIDGAPYEGVTGRALERTLADGRIRRVGFDPSGITLQVRADLARASIDSQGFRAVFKDVRQNSWTQALRRPSLETALTADLTTSATTATVADTTGWPSSGVIHIDTEAIAYSGITATSFTGLTRGVWGTVAQAHFVSNGESLYYPRVTDVPSGFEGRRARLYVYGPGDDPQGDGTLRWLGVCATDAAYQGGEWSFSIDPITRILSQPIGGDLAEGVPIRGIYYPVSAPLTIFLTNTTSGQRVVVKFTGFYDDQLSFCAALTTAIANAIAGTGGWSGTWSAGSVIYAEPVDQRSWQLVYLVGTGAGTVSQIDVGSPSPYGGARSGSPLDRFEFPSAGTWFEGDADASGTGIGTLIAGHRYYIPVGADVPRAGLGALSPDVVLDPTGSSISPSDPSASPRYLYLGGLVIPSASMAAFIEDDADPDPLRVIGSDIPARALLVQSSFHVLGPETRIRLGRTIAEGSVDSLLTVLFASSPGLANTGAMPLITPTDVQSNGDVAEVLASSAGRIGLNRVFTAFESVELREFIEHELRALGCYQRISATGYVEWKRIRVLVDTDTMGAISITDRDLKGRPRVERAQYGSLSEVLYRYGYDPSEGKWKSSMRFRDAQVSNPNRAAQSLEVARRSYPLGRILTDTGRREVTVEDVARIAMPAIGLFGGAYDVWTLPVGPRYGGTLVGDTVVVTSESIPSPDGVMGVSNALGFVVGVTDELATGQVTLEVLVHGQRYAGYAPGIEVSGQTNVSGNIWDITCSGVATYVPTADLRDVLRVGELVRVTQYDATSPTEVLGTVTSFSSATVVRVTFGAVWTPSTSTWVLRARQSTAYASGERIALYAYQAEATRRIDYTPTDAPARVFAP